MTARGFRFESLPLLFIIVVVVIGAIALMCGSYIRAAWRERHTYL